QQDQPGTCLAGSLLRRLRCQSSRARHRRPPAAPPPGDHRYRATTARRLAPGDLRVQPPALHPTGYRSSQRSRLPLERQRAVSTSAGTCLRILQAEGIKMAAQAEPAPVEDRLRDIQSLTDAALSRLD